MQKHRRPEKQTPNGWLPVAPHTKATRVPRFLPPVTLEHKVAKVVVTHGEPDPLVGMVEVGPGREE